MRNTKEIKTILSVLFFVNKLGENNKEIMDLLDYAFDRILNENTRYLFAMCLGKGKEDLQPVIEQLLREDTQYYQFKERQAALRKENKKGDK